MTDKFAKDVVAELNKFRLTPKYIQRQCEIIRTGFSRLKPNDPFLNEIDVFVKELDKLKPLRSLEINEVLCEAARKELPKFRGASSYKKYKKTSEMKGIVPDYYLAANPALCADDGAEEPINVLTKTLLNKLDKYKEGRKLLMDPTFSQVGVAHEVFDEENMVILIFASKSLSEPLRSVPLNPIRNTKNEFLRNIFYRETKDIKNPKHEAQVYHRIKGDIIGEFGKISYETYVQTHKSSKMEAAKQPRFRDRGGDRQEKFATKTTNTRTTRNIREKARAPAPVKTTAKKERITETRMGRRNEGTSSKTETRYESRTTNLGLRGKKNEGSSVTTKTVTKTVVDKPVEVVKTEETRTKNVGLRGKKNEDSSVTTKTVTKTVVEKPVEVVQSEEVVTTTTTTTKKVVEEESKPVPVPQTTETKTETVTQVEEIVEDGEGGESIRKKYVKKKVEE